MVNIASTLEKICFENSCNYHTPKLLSVPLALGKSVFVFVFFFPRAQHCTRYMYIFWHKTQVHNVVVGL